MPDDQTEIVADLESDFQDGFEGIEARPFAAQFPRGTYGLEITNAYLGRSGSSGRKQIVANCTVFEAPNAEYIGKTYTKTWGLKDAQNIEWLKRDMIALDIKPPAGASDLPRVCNELMGIKLRGNLVPNREDPEQYPPNLFLNRGARVVEGSKEGRF